MHHPTAIIDNNASLDEGVYVGPYSIIGPDVKISKGTRIESHVIINGPTLIGRDNHIFQFTSIGDGSPDKKYKGEPTQLIIGNNNVIREGVTIHRGTVQEEGVTRIGNNILLMPYSHVAHDCIIEDDAILSNQAAIAGAVKVGKGAILGGYAIVHQYCSLGDYSFCAMGSAVNKDIPAFVKVRGNPASSFGINTTGIKRIGFNSDKIDALRSAYRSAYRKKLTVEEAIQDMKPLIKKFKEVELFANSISNSKRGIAR
jgi:UDP-N-acetylglucosamine acyltransferase